MDQDYLYYIKLNAFLLPSLDFHAMFRQQRRVSKPNDDVKERGSQNSCKKENQREV